MALTEVTRRKPVTSGRNPFAPRGDRLQYLYAFDEGTGTTLTNLGYAGASYNAALVDGGGTISWEADTDEQSDESSPPSNVVRTDGSASYLSVTIPNSVDIPRWTIMVRFKHVSDTVANLDVVFNSGQATSVNETLQVSMPASPNVIRVLYRDSGGTLHTFDWDRTGTVDGKHTVIMTGGELGLYAWLDGAVPESYDVDGTPTTVPDYMDESLPTSGVDIASAAMFLGKHSTGGHGAFDFYEYGFADVQLLEEDVMDLFADPYLPIRSLTDVADLQDNVLPKVWDITASTGTVSGVVVDSPSASTGIKLYYSTSRIMHDGATIGISGTDTSSGGEQLRSLLTSLAADTQYYAYGVMHTAGSPNREHIMPGGILKFRTPPAYPVLVYTSDSHSGVSVATPSEATAVQGRDIVDNTEHATHMAIWRCDMDIRHNVEAVAGSRPARIYRGGDEIFSDSAANAAAMAVMYPLYRNRRSILESCAPVLDVMGNHEQEAGYFRHKDAAPHAAFNGQQMIATHWRKMFFPHPTNGEGDEVGSYDTTDEWIKTDEVDDADILDASYPGNATPLENFWEDEIGNATTWGLDVYRYTGDVDTDDSEHGEHFRENPEFEFGVTQKAWIEARLTASTSKWKFLLMHNLPGGEEIRDPASAGYDASKPFYAWGSGRSLSTADELWLRDLCKRHKVTAIFKGHDHRFTHVVNSSVNIITIPPSGAPSLLTNGWNYDEMEASHGEAFHEGATVSGVRKSFNAFGYLIVKCEANTCTVFVRNTWMSCGASAYSNNIDNGLTEHWLTPEVVTGSDGNPAELSERPWQVFCAIEAGEYVDGFWSNGLVGAYVTANISGTPSFSAGETTVDADDTIFLPTMVGATVNLNSTPYVISEYVDSDTIKVVGDASSESGSITITQDNYHTPVGPEEWEGCYRTNSISINDHGDTQVAVAHIPRTLESFELQNATTMQILLGGY